MGGSLGRPREDEDDDEDEQGPNGRSRGAEAVPGRGRVFKADARDSPTYGLQERLRFFEEAVDSKLVYLLETDSTLITMEMPPKSIGPDPAENWANRYFPGIPHAGMLLAERIGPIDVQHLAAQVFKTSNASNSTGGYSTGSAPFSLLGSIASSVSSVSAVSSVNRTRSSPDLPSQQPVDVCFVVLRGRQLRLVVYAVLQSIREEPAKGSCLRMTSGNALSNDEACFAYSVCDLPQGSTFALAQDLVAEELPNLKLALRTNDYETFIGGWRKIGDRPRRRPTTDF